MMYLDFASLTPRERYKLLIATVIPRPIALVSTLSPDGTLNAAPFSFFNVFSEDPAIAILGLEARRDNDGLKDTTANIESNGELVINLVDIALAKPMVDCAASLPAEEDELAFAGLTPVASKKVAVPGIEEAPIRLECTLYELQKLTSRRHLCLAQIQALSAHEGIFDKDTLHVNLEQYQPIGRLMGDSYAKLGEIFNIKIPSYPKS